MANLPIGSSFAGYIIEAIVARGGMGVVYRATQARPNRRVALKLVAPEFASDPAYRERFLREADLLASLDDCPSIVPIYAAGEDDGQLYLAMQFLDGPDLAALLKTDGPLSLSRTADLIWPVAVALDTAHEAGLVHRDVKPSNIMLDRRASVYLMDFGLTRRTDSESGLTRPGQAIGTAGYMAPEQFTGRAADPDLASRIDVYALGCVLHACLTGEEPYPRDSYEQAMFAHVYEPPPKVSGRRPDVTAEMDEILARALAKDPRDRYARATDLAQAVRALADRLAIADARPGEAEGAPAPVVARSSPNDAVPPAPAERRPIGAATVIRPADGASTVVVPVAALPAPPKPPGRGPLLPQLANGSGRTAMVVAGVLIAVVSGLALLRPWSDETDRDTSPSPSTQAEASRTPSPEPTPIPTEDPTPSPVPTESATPTSEAIYGSDADVAGLIATLPVDMRDSCVTYQLFEPGAIAAVECARPQGGFIWYTKFGDRASMDSWYAQSVAGSGVASDVADCGGGNECERSWFFEASEQDVQGRILCQLTDDATAFIDFTVDANLIMATMLDGDGDLAALYEEWASPGLIPIVG